MNLILHLLLDAAVIFGLAYVMPQVDVKSFGKAFLVAIILAFLNVTIGWLLRGVGNLVTFFALSFVIRLVVTALLLKLVDSFMSSLTIQGFWPALVIALAVAVAGAVLDQVLAPTPAATYDSVTQLMPVSLIQTF
ncbi:phage holin family protein [Siphonobacter sp. SORGH_AS_1065]|uniref:phage holin family protein n=1 Tax=Siphonobacter sp. SORGH_AS_1065 TaxID=3041795 RepID=UPI002782BCBD|nr:phage holin family protein [Siphonobacter sp. SORGH_AS_1065]MDQ1087761.1 putative membrane protein [Siphonobacter sp. SORGH_AS_1065]